MSRKFTDANASGTRRPYFEQYSERQPNGTLQNRAANAIGALNNTNGKTLMEAAVLPGRQTAQIAAAMVALGIPLVTSYVYDANTGRGALPIFGKASEIGARTVLNPALAHAVKLT